MAEDGIEFGAADEPADFWRKGLAGALGLIAGAVLFGLILLVAHSNSARELAQKRERNSYDILLIVRGLDASMMRSEAELGRFVINGRRETGTLYYDAWKQAGRQLHRLAQLTAENPEQAELTKALKQAYDRRSEELAAPAMRASYKQGWAALSLFDKAGRSDTLPEISSILAKIEANERAILDKRSDRTLNQTDWSNKLISLLSGMGLLIGVSALLLGWLAFNAVQQRRAARQAAQVEADRAAMLQMTIAERTRELREVNEKLRTEAETRAAAEAQLRQVQKMEAVGQLTGGIAHDFNNMLAVVVGALDLARRRLTRDSEELNRHLENAMEGASRAASLTRRLLSFARNEPLLPDGTSPARLIAGMSDLLDRTLGERIEVVIKGQESDWLVWVDPHQLENALVNLAVNARDAMEDEGVLTIRTQQVRLGDGEVGSLHAGEYVCITVSDTGCGMSPEVLERAFEPFFTTKPVGKGTGLGLSQVFGFVRQSMGEVVIRSRPREGTWVSIYLPRHVGVLRGDSTLLDDTIGGFDERAVSGLRIMVVEDDQRVRTSTCAALQELGHSVIACSSGDEALVELTRNDDIGLLITDVVMPGMTGPELVSRVEALYPEMPVLFVTGFAGDASDAVSGAGHELLRKPFTVSMLAQAIASALRRNLSVRHRRVTNGAGEPAPREVASDAAKG